MKKVQFWLKDFFFSYLNLLFLFFQLGQIFTSVLVTCPSERIERLVCGAENGKLKQITERATSDLVETFSKPVSLTVCTKTKLPNKP